MQTFWNAVYFNKGCCENFHYNIMHLCRWAEAPIKIARMTLTIKLDGNWSSFQLANSAPPLSVTDSAIAPSARIPNRRSVCSHRYVVQNVLFLYVWASSNYLMPGTWVAAGTMHVLIRTAGSFHVRLLGTEVPAKIQEVTLMRPIHGNL